MPSAGSEVRAGERAREIGVLNIFSYFRRTPARPRRQPVADDDVIDLSSIGGVINGTYLDIASLPDAAVRTRGKAPPRPRLGAHLARSTVQRRAPLLPSSSLSR